MSKIFDRLVEKRGLDSDFLNPKYLSDENIFEHLPDMDCAILKIIEAIENDVKIMVYGDYDVDGVTATTVMVDALKMAGAKDIVTMLPDRFVDGYGMSERCVERAQSEGVGLIITVDCGSNNSEVISKLKEAGIKTIVTDHHEVLGELPEAEAIVNPKRTDVNKTEREKVKKTGLIDLAGVGVSFMVACALVKANKIKNGQEKWLLDLVLIGTLCDSMTISKINRELTFYGLKVLEKTRRPGLKELMRVAKISKINAETIGFQIGPRLNAGGRIKSAEISLKLLMTESKTEAVKLAEELDQLNAKRREEQQSALKEIADTGADNLKKPVIVVAGEWHEGVLGIIAGRLVEKYHKPAFALSKVETKDKNGDGVLNIYKGSGRSFGEFNLAEAIRKCKKDLLGGGGHAGACGLSLLSEKLQFFEKDVNDYYDSLKLKNQERFLKIAFDLDSEELADFSVELLGELKQLEPFGEGNLEPRFKLKSVKTVEVRKVGKDQNHLRLTVADKAGNKMTLVSFYAPEEWLNLEENLLLDVTISLMKNEWNGRVFAEGHILDIVV